MNNRQRKMLSDFFLTMELLIIVLFIALKCPSAIAQWDSGSSGGSGAAADSSWTSITIDTVNEGSAGELLFSDDPLFSVGWKIAQYQNVGLNTSASNRYWSISWTGLSSNTQRIYLHQDYTKISEDNGSTDHYLYLDHSSNLSYFGGNVGFENSAPNKPVDVTGQVWMSDSLMVGNYTTGSWIGVADEFWNVSSNSGLKANVIPLNQIYNPDTLINKFASLNNYRWNFDSTKIRILFDSTKYNWDDYTRAQKDSVKSDYKIKEDKRVKKISSAIHFSKMADHVKEKFPSQDGTYISGSFMNAVRDEVIRALIRRVEALEKRLGVE